MSNIKDMKNQEIQDYINTHNHMDLETTKKLIESLNEGISKLDNTKLLTEILPRLLKPTPHEVRLSTDDWNNFDYEFSLQCVDASCPIINDEVDCKSCSYYKKYPTIKEAYEQAVTIRTMEINHYLFGIEWGDYGYFNPKRKFYIKENNRDLNYLLRRCDEV